MWPNNFKKNIQRVFKRLVYFMPEMVKFPLIRYIIRYSPEIKPEIIIKIADTSEEVEAAFHVVHRAYQANGFAYHPYELNKYQILPTSTILVALWRGQVVGTLTLVKRNRLGLPLERAFQIDGMVGPHEQVAEITCMAIDRNYRREFGIDVLFPLMKFMYQYAIDYFSVRRIYVVCLPRESDFYRSILLFELIPGLSKTEDYLGAPAIALYLDLHNARVQFQKVYGGLRADRNLYHYFVEYKSSQLKFPNRSTKEKFDSIWNAETFRYFLSREKGYFLPKLTDEEYHHLQQMYDSCPEVQKILRAG